MLIRLILVLVTMSALAGCAVKGPYAADAEVAAATFVAEGPPSLTLFTVINNRSGAGAHAGLMINGDQRLMFDAAGSWYNPGAPQRNDIHYGMTDQMVNYYVDYHARETFRVVQQTVPVSAAVARQVMANAIAYGSVPPAQCTYAISSVLAGVEGLESLRVTWFPKRLMQQFAELPGVVETVTTDEDSDENKGMLISQQAEATN